MIWILRCHCVLWEKPCKTDYCIYPRAHINACPVKMLLKDLLRKGPFSSIPARSCEILWDIARFLQNPTRSHKILQECKNKGLFLGRSCNSIFTGWAKINAGVKHSKVNRRLYKMRKGFNCSFRIVYSNCLKQISVYISV